MTNMIDSRRTVRATRVIASTAGVLCGISGLEHGFFETLQGSTAPNALLISAIGPAQRFWPGGAETALTIVPNFLVTGILAMIASLMVILWSAAFIQRKHGALIFLALSLVQFLVGGGFAQILLVPIIAAGATQIGSAGSSRSACGGCWQSRGMNTRWFSTAGTDPETGLLTAAPYLGLARCYYSTDDTASYLSGEPAGPGGRLGSAGG